MINKKYCEGCFYDLNHPQCQNINFYPPNYPPCNHHSHCNYDPCLLLLLYFCNRRCC